MYVIATTGTELPEKYKHIYKIIKYQGCFTVYSISKQSIQIYCAVIYKFAANQLYRKISIIHNNSYFYI